MDKKMWAKIGSWAFIGGIFFAGLVGIYQAYTLEDGGNFLASDTGVWVAWILAIIGAIVGILAILGKGTITSKETPGFLLAGIALVVMYGVFNGATLSPWLGSLFAGVSYSLAIFVAPAVGLLAIRAIYDMGKD
jgi:hypothetical protein